MDLICTNYTIVRYYNILISVRDVLDGGILYKKNKKVMFDYLRWFLNSMGVWDFGSL